jgi:hypothetical protein
MGFGCFRKGWPRSATPTKLPYNAWTLFLTNYRPNFCSECGERIVRLRWRVWTSRRFCDKCSPGFRRAHLVQRTCAAASVLLLGILIGRGWRSERPPLVIQRMANVSPPGEASSQPSITVEQTYQCGARTKKGTPCSRRVHGPVRCWQHKGAKAMLPLEKLLIKE